MKNKKCLLKLTVANFIIIPIVILLVSAFMDVIWPVSTLADPPAQGLKRVADFYFDVAAGDVRGMSSVNKFGGNPDVDSAAVEDIWDGGGVWSEPTVGQVYTVTSTSAADTGDGTGARTLEINGLDGTTGLLQSETITLSGVTPITLTNQYQMIHRMIVRSGGSGGVNAGTIAAVANTDATVTAQVNAGNNQTLMAIYKIPAGSDGCLLNFYASLLKATGQTATINVIVKAKPTGEVYQTKHKIGVIKDGTSALEHEFFVPNCFEPLTIIKISADTNVDDVDMSAGFDLILHPN